MTSQVRILFVEPCIPNNTGSTMRLSALTGAELHLAGPLGFDLDDAKLKRAGLDYRDRSRLFVHDSLEDAFAALLPARVFAFTARAATPYTSITYEPGDVLMFGSEPSGLRLEVLADPRITHQVVVPMLPGNRSLNLASTAAVAVYEAWRQLGFTGA